MGHVGDGPDQVELVVVALLGEQALQLHGAVEVVLDGLLAAAGDDEDVVEPGPDGLLDDVLNGGLVDQGQHLLRLRLGRREEAGPEPGRWDDGLAYLHDAVLPEAASCLPETPILLDPCGPAGPPRGQEIRLRVSLP
jgi:hypothetical protein